MYVHIVFGQRAIVQKLAEERHMIQEAARRFRDGAGLPIANKLDSEKGSIPRELIDEMAELDYFALLSPGEYGELGLGEKLGMFTQQLRSRYHESLSGSQNAYRRRLAYVRSESRHKSI